jgi:hypothetical protein
MLQKNDRYDATEQRWSFEDPKPSDSGFRINLATPLMYALVGVALVCFAIIARDVIVTVAQALLSIIA